MAVSVNVIIIIKLIFIAVVLILIILMFKKEIKEFFKKENLKKLFKKINEVDEKMVDEDKKSVVCIDCGKEMLVPEDYEYVSVSGENYFCEPCFKKSEKESKENKEEVDENE